MAFRALKQKKYNGLSEYYNPKSPDKETRAIYAIYRDADGKGQKQKLSTLDLDEARNMISTIKAEVARTKKLRLSEQLHLDRAAQTGKLTLDQVADLYFTQRRTKDNDHDRHNYEKRVSPLLGSKRVNSLATSHVQELQDVLSKGYAPKTVNETINSLRALFNTAIDEGWATSNPVDRKKVTALENDQEDGRIFTDDELTILWDELKIDQRLLLFSQILYYTGARPGAVIDLQVKHINQVAGTISFKAMKKGKAYSRKPNPDVMIHLQKWVDDNDLTRNDYIFSRPEDRSKPINYTVIGRQYKRLFDRLFNQGIDEDDRRGRLTPYSFRRTSGTKMYNAKGLVQAMKFLNHSKIDTTMIYLSINEDDLCEAEVL